MKSPQKPTQRTEDVDWVAQTIADVIQRPVSLVTPQATLQEDLGFDSLMLTELATALEARGVPMDALKNLAHLTTVSEVRQLLQAAHSKSAMQKSPVPSSLEVSSTLQLPKVLAQAGRAALDAGQHALYATLFRVKTTGQVFIPFNRNVLVVANHASHLDMGLVKMAMGQQGSRLVALAARDYFFNTPMKRAYFENFTNLIPMERHGSLRESLRLAGRALNQGYNLLIFPEGTRSSTGAIMEFKPTIGYIALTYGVDVLPVYLHGTFNALPKGAFWPKRENLEVRFGPPLPIEVLRERTQGMPRNESYRTITQIAEKAVRELAQGRVYQFDGTFAPTMPVQEKRRGRK